MDDILPSSLKTILHSKRTNIYYLEKCRVMQKDGRVLYLTEAIRMLASAGILVGFLWWWRNSTFYGF